MLKDVFESTVWLVEWESGKTEKVFVRRNHASISLGYGTGSQWEAWGENWPDAVVSAVALGNPIKRFPVNDR